MYFEYDLMFHYLLASLRRADGVNSVTSTGVKLFNIMAGRGGWTGRAQVIASCCSTLLMLPLTFSCRFALRQSSPIYGLDGVASKQIVVWIFALRVFLKTIKVNKKTGGKRL